MIVVANIVRQRRSPASSVAWLVTILVLPLIGLPLFWLFGNRKIKRIAKDKPSVVLTPDPTARSIHNIATGPALRHLRAVGLSHGNFIKFHDNGEAAFADLIFLIDTAQKQIHVETYVFKADATGLAIIERLIAKAKEGLQVRLLIDGFGSFYMSRKHLRRLTNAGAKCAFFLPVWRIARANRGNLRDHRKIVVVDNERVFSGGRNLAEEYLGVGPDPNRWTDFSFILDGPAAAHYDEIFRYDWHFASKELLPAVPRVMSHTRQQAAVMQVVPSGPDVTDDRLFEGITSFIFAAKRRLWIVTPYFMPNEMLAQALEIAIERGVDVRVIVPEKSDQLLVDLARGQFLRDLSALGCKVLLYTPGMLHGKAMLVDDAAAIVGSANFDTRSMFLNFEVSSVIYSDAEIKAVESWVVSLVGRTRPLDGSVGTLRDTVEGVARLITPML
ncbi:MAG TPA: phospholipase D-like domain-containing protein [Hyphomicrobium sp.]|nr:phospholipase D-like domain-containing protein [Hyphomicrobium sp.]